MAITKEQKKKILEDLREKITKQKAMIFVDFTGLKVKDLSELRKKIKTVDGELKVAKKSLMSVAFQERNLKINPKELQGEIALIFGFKDEMSPVKTVWQFSQRHPNLKIVGGILENKFFEAEKIIELAKLPAKEELLANLVGNISAPIYNFVNVLQAPLEACIFIIRSLGENKIGK